MDEVGIHPNGYFEASLTYYSGDKDKDNSRKRPTTGTTSMNKSPIKGSQQNSMIN